MNRIRIRLRYLRPHARTSLGYDVTEHLGGVLLALVVADDTDLNLLLVAEVLMIVHLTRDEGVGSGFHGIVEQEVAGTATESHTAHRTLQQLVGHRTGNAKRRLHRLYELTCCQWRLQRSDDAAAASHVANGSRCHELHVLQPQLLGHLVVHATLGIVHVRVHRHHGDVRLDGLSHGALHVSHVADLLQAPEQQRMMADDEVTPLRQRLVHHLFGDVQTQ